MYMFLVIFIEFVENFKENHQFLKSPRILFYCSFYVMCILNSEILNDKSLSPLQLTGKAINIKEIL